MKERFLFEEEFCICGVLGSGKFATVYKAMHKSTQQYYAAKILDKNQQSHIDTEIKILTDFRHHKNIVTLYEVYQDCSETVLVLELVQGGELLELLGKEVLTEHDMTHLVEQLCSALYCLHYKHIVHMDVKPENVLVTMTTDNIHKPTLKLVDFGLARVLQNGRSGAGNLDQIRGTPEFLAPELLRAGGRVSPAVDMWCVGVTLFILLTGVSPFEGEDVGETVANILNCNYQAGDELFEGYSSDALDFISSLLNPSPHERYTAADCLKHPWLSKKNRSKQRQYPLKYHTESGVPVVDLDNTMGRLRTHLAALSVTGNSNIKPSSVARNYKTGYK